MEQVRAVADKWTGVEGNEAESSRPPGDEMKVDFGVPEPGYSRPMPNDRREQYENRIRNSLDAQAAGAERASKIFIR